MKTIFAFSDIHERTFPAALLPVAEESDYVFFLGDGVARLRELSAHKGFYAVKGNCDSVDLPHETVLEIEGVRVLLTHGDAYRVKSDLLPLSCRAKELNCSLVFFGHTHVAEIVKDDDVTLINPGSLGQSFFSPPSYAYTVIEKGKVVSKIVRTF